MVKLKIFYRICIYTFKGISSYVEDQFSPYEHMYKEETSKGSLERQERATSFPGFSPTPGENLGTRLGNVLTSQILLTVFFCSLCSLIYYFKL